MHDAQDTLPSIEEWWPHLTIGARHSLLRDPQGPLEQRVRDEICRTTGQPVGERVRLSDEDLAFIRTQQETVD